LAQHHGWQCAGQCDRGSADFFGRMLTGFCTHSLIRVGIVNAATTSLYSVGKVVAFGSYLGNQDRVGDIDLAIRLDRRPEFAPRWPEALLARAEAAENHGRRFRGFLKRLAWPETEVKRYLRGGVRSLSLHDWTKEEPWLQHAAIRYSSKTDRLRRRRSPRRRDVMSLKWDFHQSRSNNAGRRSGLVAALSDQGGPAPWAPRLVSAQAGTVPSRDFRGPPLNQISEWRVSRPLATERP